MNRLSLCIKKDRMEFLRSKKLVVGSVVLAAFLAMLLALTASVPKLTTMVAESVEIDFLGDGMGAITDFLTVYFPQNLLDSCAFFSTEIGLFYSILAIAFSYNVLPRDIKSGRLILPICNGYQQKEIFFSKQIVYALFLSLPSGIFYFLYYLIGSTFLYNNYPIGDALISSGAMIINLFFIICITVALSVIYKHSILVIISMGLTVAASPDLLNAIPFGKYIPTFIYTYLNYSMTEPIKLLIPIIEYVVIIVLLDLIVFKRKFAIVVDERR